jgi:hypothetical protein
MFSKREMMDFKGSKLRLSVFLLLFLFLFIFACSTPSWFPIKKGPSSKAKIAKDLEDKEVIIIDKEEYVKVYNSSTSAGSPKYLYIPVKEYLAKKGTYKSISYKKEVPKKGPSPSLPLSQSPLGGDQILVSAPQSSSSGLKKKVVITYFDDRTVQTEEIFGDWIAEKLVREVDRRAQRILLVDYRMVREFLESRGIALTDMQTPGALRLLNEVFGVHALVFGHLAGPYTFVAKGEKEPEGTASALIKIEIKLIDTLTGKTLKNLEATNPSWRPRRKDPFRKRGPR